MSFEKEIKLVEELCMTPGISGHEEKIAEITKSYACISYG